MTTDEKQSGAAAACALLVMSVLLSCSLLLGLAWVLAGYFSSIWGG